MRALPLQSIIFCSYEIYRTQQGKELKNSIFFSQEINKSLLFCWLSMRTISLDVRKVQQKITSLVQSIKKSINFFWWRMKAAEQYRNFEQGKAALESYGIRFDMIPCNKLAVSVDEQSNMTTAESVRQALLSHMLFFQDVEMQPMGKGQYLARVSWSPERTLIYTRQKVAYADSH